MGISSVVKPLPEEEADQRGDADPAAAQDLEFKQAFADLNRKFEEEQTQRRARLWQFPYFSLLGYPIRENELALLTEAEARHAQAVPFLVEGELVKIGAVDPSHPELKRTLERLRKKNYEPEIHLVSPSSLNDALKQYKRVVAPIRQETKEVVVTGGADAPQRLKVLGESAQKLKSMAVTDLLQTIIGAAAWMRASDIHLEPEKTSLKMRYRVDGVLQEILTLPKEIFPRLLSRIKLLSGLKLNITNQPQDGRFTVRWGERQLDLRVSVLPSAFGETVVMRILGLEERTLAVGELGFSEQTTGVILEELKKRTGMILTTGPTGSGKTTTLYAFLSHLNKPGVNMVTLEDPIEYRLSGVTQTPIHHEAGVDFAGGLRAVLRQDPDIIMVGEIRDSETANTAVQAALTGHLVLSTLHTNDAAGAIPRLLDMGANPVNLAPALNALIAQRLLRRICLACKEVYRPGPEERARVDQILEQIKKVSREPIPASIVFYHSRGCGECHNLGYKGRVGIFEAFAVDDKIKRLVFNQASSMDIKQAVVEGGMLTLQQDGILKALSGITDLAEVWRVTEE